MLSPMLISCLAWGLHSRTDLRSFLIITWSDAKITDCYVFITTNELDPRLDTNDASESKSYFNFLFALHSRLDGGCIGDADILMEASSGNKIWVAVCCCQVLSGHVLISLHIHSYLPAPLHARRKVLHKYMKAANCWHYSRPECVCF